MSVPAQMRCELGFDQHPQAMVEKHQGHLVIKPVKDLFVFAGAFKHKAIKNKSAQGIIDLEEEVVAEAVAERYRRENKL